MSIICLSICLCTADNRSRLRRQAQGGARDFSVFKQEHSEQAHPRMSPQLTLATFQYLQTSEYRLMCITTGKTKTEKILSGNACNEGHFGKSDFYVDCHDICNTQFDFPLVLQQISLLIWQYSQSDADLRQI